MLEQVKTCGSCEHYSVKDRRPFCAAANTAIRFYDPEFRCAKGPWQVEVEYKYDPAKPRGLGDLVKSLTDAVGIKQCGGCAERQAKLNKLFPLGGDTMTPGNT